MTTCDCVKAGCAGWNNGTICASIKDCPLPVSVREIVKTVKKQKVESKK